MLQAYLFIQPPKDKDGADVIIEFSITGKGDEIVVNEIVNVILVGIDADEKLVLTLCLAHRRFKADFVGLIRSHLAGQERLSHL